MDDSEFEPLLRSVDLRVTRPRLAVVVAQDVDLVGVRERLERTVDGGEPDPVPRVTQARMDLLRAAERRVPGQLVAHGAALPAHDAATTIHISPTPPTVLSSVRRDGCRACASGRMSAVARYSRKPAKPPR